MNYPQAEKCSVENCQNYSVNKKYKLCNFHNWLRLHPGKSSSDFYNKNQFISKKIFPIKQFSKKNLTQSNKLRTVYSEMNKMEQECSGCGTTNHLSRAHLIPRNYRKDLEIEIKNIRWYCMQRADGSKGCHNRWEGNLEMKKTLLDFEKNMEYIQKVDEKYYNLILMK